MTFPGSADGSSTVPGGKRRLGDVGAGGCGYSLLASALRTESRVNSEGESSGEVGRNRSGKMKDQGNVHGPRGCVPPATSSGRTVV